MRYIPFASEILNKPFQQLNTVTFCCCICIYTQRNISVLQDSNRYMTHPSVQVKSNSQFTNIPLTERHHKIKKEIE